MTDPYIWEPLDLGLKALLRLPSATPTSLALASPICRCSISVHMLLDGKEISRCLKVMGGIFPAVCKRWVKIHTGFFLFLEVLRAVFEMKP